jgi:hypothetical protein
MDSQSRLWNWAAIALLACTALVLAAGPVFPSQDGPVHLYYVDVLRGVLTHSAPYAQHFEIKSVLTPYALEYYSLLALEAVFSPAVSEKVLLTCYIFAFGLGFRYLVESVAERASPWTLAGIPFCMNVLVYMGFLNYSMAVALLLFLCGSWIRFSGRLTAGRATALFAGLVLMLLTHPVPVAVFLLFIGVYLLVDAAQGAVVGRQPWKACLRARVRPLALIAAMGAVAVAWVGLFVDRSQMTNDPSYISVLGWFDTLATELQLYPVAPFRSLLYRASLILLIAGAGFVFLTRWWKDGRLVRSGAIALGAVSAVCFVLFCVVPPRINGSFYFAERFPILWILFLLAAAAAVGPPRRWSVSAGAAAACVTVFVLCVQWGQISRIDAQLAPALHSPPAPAGSLGLIVGSINRQPDGLLFNPYLWGGVHYFRRSQSILANEPWMNSPMIMLRPVRPNPWSYLDPDDAKPVLLTSLASDGAARSPDFAVEQGPSDFDTVGLMKRMGWVRTGPQTEFIGIYRPQH